MYILLILILIILCSLLCIFLYKYKKKGSNNHKGGYDDYKGDKLKSYIENYMKSDYNDDAVRRRLMIILYNQGKNYHNKNMGDIVIDTLNVLYFINGIDMSTHIGTELIYKGIEYMAKKIKKFFFGRVMFVIKDKNTLLNNKEEREKYSLLAKKLKIFIYCAEKYNSTVAPNWNKPNWYDSKLHKQLSENIHSTESRDDLTILILAVKYRCPILSNDNFRDSEEYRATVAPFKVLEYNWFSSKVPIIETYKPENLEKKFTFSNVKIKLENMFMHGEYLIIHQHSLHQPPQHSPHQPPPHYEYHHHPRSQFYQRHLSNHHSL
jgi:hypothetical protein